MVEKEEKNKVEKYMEKNWDKIEDKDDIKTSELLDLMHYVNCHYDDLDEGRDAEIYLGDIREEIESRPPFWDIFNEEDGTETIMSRLNGMQIAIDNIKRHRHMENGEAFVTKKL